MNRCTSRVIGLCGAVCLVLGVGAMVLAQPEKPAQPEQDWAAMSAPGEEHKRLTDLAGNWKQTVRMFDGEKAEEFAGTVSYRSVMGGRFIVEEVKTKLGDMPFEWMGVLGFDKSRGVYTGFWVDNVSTSTERAEGTFDAATRTINFAGKHADPTTGHAEFKWLVRLDDPKTMTITMMEPDGEGKDRRVMEIVQVRE